MSASTTRDNVGVVDLKRRAVHIGAGVGPGVTVQINRSVDTAGIEGRAGRIITKQNNRFAAGSLRLERFVHGVVGLIADLGEIGLFYAERAVCVLLNRRTFDDIRHRVFVERTAGDLNSGHCGFFCRNQTVVIRVGAQRAGDIAAGDEDSGLLAGCGIIVDGGNIAVDRAALEVQRTAVDLDGNEVVLRECTAIDGQGRPCAYRIVAKADKGRVLHADNTAGVRDIAAFEYEEAISTLNVNDVVGIAARDIRIFHILALDRTGLVRAGILDRDRCIVNLQSSLAFASAAVEGEAVQVEREGFADGDVFAGISKHRDDRFRLGRVDGFLEGFVLDIASFGNVGDLRQRAFVPLVAGGGFDHDVTVVVGHGVDGFVRRRRSAPHMDAPL